MTNGAVPRVYLDTNVFIVAFEHSGASSEHAWWVIRAVEAGEIFAGTSELTLAEVLVKPLDCGQADLAEGYGKMMVSGSHFEVMPVQRDILIEAARIRARRNAIRLPDALHIATAKALACGYFISNDRRLTLPEGMRLLAVNPFTLDDIMGGKP